jgi:adenosylhomocysteine nucleosidase
VICALPEELAYLRSVIEAPESLRVGHIEFVSGDLDGRQIVLAGAGMGKVNGAVVSTLLADRFACGPLVFSGVAGGVDPELSVGDVVIADRVIQHDAGVIENGRLQIYQAGHVPFINPTERLGYVVDATLIARVRSCLDGFRLPALSRAAGGTGGSPRIVYAPVLSGDQFLHCDTTRGRWHREFDGAAVEMEGGAVAQVAESFGVPWLVIRALSDLAGHDSHLDFMAFAAEVATSSATILRRLLAVL